MPVTITPVSAVTAINAPVNNEAGDAGALIATTIQPIANQLQRERDRIRWGGNAAMAAQTNVLVGDIWINDAYGTYVAQSASFGLGAFWEVASTGTPGIYWRNSAWYETLQANRGVVRYGPITGYDDATPNGKIPVSHLTNRFHLSKWISGVERLDETISASQVLVITTHSGAHTPAVVGDIIDGQVGPIRLINMATAPSNAYAYMRIRVTDAYSTPGEIQYHYGEVILSPLQDIVVTVPFHHVVQTGTITNVQIQLTSSASGAFQAIGLNTTDFAIGTITVHRP
jgi:hypothetical protein